jgi:hypothetical protein
MWYIYICCTKAIKKDKVCIKYKNRQCLFEVLLYSTTFIWNEIVTLLEGGSYVLFRIRVI